MMSFLSFAGPYVLDTIKGYFRRKSELKNLAKNKKHELAKFRLEKKFDIENAEIVANKSIRLARIEQVASSFKDELILIFFLVAITLGAFDTTAPYVLKAWSTLTQAPEIIQGLIVVAITSALGVSAYGKYKKKK
tara:strand:+ start:37 stop:441 length:405 start_codon:yes stop_codon:yes gene_type:complete